MVISYKSIGLEIGGDANIGGVKIADITRRRPKINAIRNNFFNYPFSFANISQDNLRSSKDLKPAETMFHQRARFPTSANAIESRCFYPPDNCLTRELRFSAMPSD
jgi:hypothetical protein